MFFHSISQQKPQQTPSFQISMHSLIKKNKNHTVRSIFRTLSVHNSRDLSLSLSVFSSLQSKWLHIKYSRFYLLLFPVSMTGVTLWACGCVTQIARSSLALVNLAVPRSLYCHTSNMPICQVPAGTFGIRWQIHNIRQQHDLVLKGPSST